MGLAITRKVGDSFWINDDVRVTIIQQHGQSIKIHIEADTKHRILREEIRELPLPLINGRQVSLHEGRYY